MPYIPEPQRFEADKIMRDEGLLQYVPSNAGELNWMVTTLIDNYLKHTGTRYAHLNEMIGALECCKLELYRRIASPYEDDVKEINGDAYFCNRQMGADY